MNMPGEISREGRLNRAKVEVVVVFFSPVVKGGMKGVLGFFQGKDSNRFWKELIEADQKAC